MQGDRESEVDWTGWHRLALRTARRICSDPQIVEDAVERACHEILCACIARVLVSGVEAVLVVRVRSRVIDLLRERGRGPKRMTVDLDAVCAAVEVGDPAPNRHKASRVAPVRAQLTDRQRLVCEGLVAGSPKKAIARELGISPKAVREAIAGIRKKLSAGTPPPRR
jgi:DNA-binding NarL/FixJ family response regulator